jgi:hypothetical protein
MRNGCFLGTGCALVRLSQLKELLVPYPAAEEMRMWEVSPRINSPKNDDPSLWEPLHSEPTLTTTHTLELLREQFSIQSASASRSTPARARSFALVITEVRSAALPPYVSIGKFALRGFPETEELFARSLLDVDSEEYLKPLVAAANDEVSRLQGYRVVGRKLNTEFIREFGEGHVRPFLARELLNVPRLPYSPRQFADVMLGAVNVEEKEREFIGYLVEWEGTFDSFTSDKNQIVITRGRPNSCVTSRQIDHKRTNREFMSRSA